MNKIGSSTRAALAAGPSPFRRVLESRGLKWSALFLSLPFLALYSIVRAAVLNRVDQDVNGRPNGYSSLDLYLDGFWYIWDPLVTALILTSAINVLVLALYSGSRQAKVWERGACLLGIIAIVLSLLALWPYRYWLMLPF